MEFWQAMRDHFGLTGPGKPFTALDADELFFALDVDSSDSLDLAELVVSLKQLLQKARDAAKLEADLQSEADY